MYHSNTCPSRAHRSLRRASLLPLLLLLVGMSLASLSNPAFAQSFDELSREQQKRFDGLLDKAITAYEKDRFEEALKLCQQAAEILPHPATMYLPARIADRQGQCSKAVELYKNLLDLPAAGPPEARWLAEYKGALERNLESLGNCEFRIELACDAKDHGAVVVANGRVLGTCPQTFELEQAKASLVLLKANGAVAERSIEVQAGRVQTVTFKALPAATPPSGAGVLQVDCGDLGQTAVLFENAKPIAACPAALRLSAGQHRLEALDDAGRRAVLVVDVEPSQAEQSVAMVMMRELRLACSDEALELELVHPLLEAPLRAACGELAKTPPLLPDGTITVLATKERFRPLERRFELGPQNDRLELEPLEALPVRFSVRCSDVVEPPVYVRVGSFKGRCPFEAELPAGKHSVQARREGHHPWTSEWSIGHEQNSFDIGSLEPRSFFSAGVITTGAAALLLGSAVVVDLLGYGALEDLRSAANSGDADNYDKYRSTVNTTIWTTRILYGVGIAAAGTGLGLLIYEAVSSDPDDFADEQSLRLVPIIGTEQAGLGLHWRF